MKWLSYQPERRRPWTEHNCFPKGAIKYIKDNPRWHNLDKLLIFEMSDDRTQIKFIPKEEWPDE